MPPTRRPKSPARLLKNQSRPTRIIFLPIWASRSWKCKIRNIEPAVETAGKALELDPSIGVANFIQAIGYFKLNRLDAAEKSAQMAEKGPHQNMPDLHAVHAEILLQKQDYPNAAAQMRAYLKEFPQGRFADQMKKDLQQIEKSEADAGSKPDSAQPQIAP